MSPFNPGEFTDMDGKAVEEAGEPLPIFDTSDLLHPDVSVL
jgi:hypothetical protein